VRTEENAALVRRKNLKTPLEMMLEIINDPDTSEDRRDRFIIAAAPYLHAKPTSLMMGDAAVRQFSGEKDAAAEEFRAMILRLGKIRDGPNE
jgi:hypothetical protein